MNTPTPVTKLFQTALVLFFLTIFSYAHGAEENYAERKEVQNFIAEQVKKGLNKESLEKLFSSITKNQKVLDLMQKAPERKSTWGGYKKIFITKKRIDQGKKFYTQYKEQLKSAEKKYGVPAEIITAILGVETYYGNRTGSHKVVRSLTTLAFDHPGRGKFFRKELAAFLQLANEQGFDPTTLSGSYAGAMGYPQFMPSSYLAYAVDFNQDGSIDIWQQPLDAIGSIANYLEKAGWKANRPVMERIYTDNTSDFAKQANKSLKPYADAKTLDSLNISPAVLKNEPKFSLVLVEADDKKQMWLGGANFYAITRYNISRLYALAVYHLAKEIKE